MLKPANPSAISFGGVYVAMPSCYDANGEIDPAAVRKLTRYLIQSGIQGVYVCGSTGEGILQRTAERKLVLEAVAAENQGEIQLIAHVGAVATAESVELAIHAEQHGADAISSIPPFYYRPSESAVKRHWLAMIEATRLPFIIYHIPATTGFTVSPALFQELAAHPQVAGLKITTPSTYELQQFAQLGGEQFFVFNGPDEQYLAGRIMGACGGIGGTYGAMPELFVRLERCYAQGKLQEAQLWQSRINEIITAMLALPIHAAIKAIISRRAVNIGAPRLPLEPLQAGHGAEIERITAMIDGYAALCQA